MSMTKRYLQSLPEAKQNAILGEPDYFQRLAEPVDTFTQPVAVRKCNDCGDALPARITGDNCEYCQMRTDRRARCDRYYGSRR